MYPYYGATLALVLIAGGAGFGLGRHTAPAAAPQTASARTFGNAPGGTFPGGGTGTGRGARGVGGAGGAGGGFVTGQVTAVSGDIVTVQAATGVDTPVLISSSTDISKTVTGAVGDVAVGQTVQIRGTQADDGSVTATSFQIRPATAAGTL